MCTTIYFFLIDVRLSHDYHDFITNKKWQAPRPVYLLVVYRSVLKVDLHISPHISVACDVLHYHQNHQTMA